ncbi:hypothetical protein V8F33_011768 [Rhypophila sp. PSN 637]
MTASEEEKNGLPATRVLPDMESDNEEQTEANYDGALLPAHGESTKKLELPLANEMLEHEATKFEIKKLEGSTAIAASARVVAFTFHFIYNLLMLFVLHYHLPVHWTDKASPLFPSLAHFSNGGILVKAYTISLYIVLDIWVMRLSSRLANKLWLFSSSDQSKRLFSACSEDEKSRLSMIWEKRISPELWRLVTVSEDRVLDPLWGKRLVLTEEFRFEMVETITRYVADPRGRKLCYHSAWEMLLEHQGKLLKFSKEPGPGEPEAAPSGGSKTSIWTRICWLCLFFMVLHGIFTAWSLPGLERMEQFSMEPVKIDQLRARQLQMEQLKKALESLQAVLKEKEEQRSIWVQGIQALEVRESQPPFRGLCSGYWSISASSRTKRIGPRPLYCIYKHGISTSISRSFRRSYYIIAVNLIPYFIAEL